MTYTATDKGLKFPVNLSSVDGSDTLQTLLQELVDNGRGDSVDDGVFIPSEEIAALNRFDRDILGLPKAYPNAIRVDARGDFGQEEMSLEVGYYEHPRGKQFASERTGAIITVDGREYSLTAAQLEAVEKAGEIRGHQRREERLTRFGKFKAALANTRIATDSWIEKENVVIPDRFELSVERRDNRIHIQPQLPGHDQFTDKFRADPIVRSDYSLSDEEGNRVRIALSDSQITELRKAKKFLGRGISEETTQELVERAAEVFDPDVFDLDLFSQRVIDVGIYKPRFYPFISPYKTEWFPGFVVEGPRGEQERVLIKSIEDAEELQEAIKNAESARSATVEFRGNTIPLDNARDICQNATEQLANRSTPRNQADGKQVLIIAENVETLGFEKQADLALAELEYTFEAPPGLRSEFQTKDHQKEGIAWLQALSKRTSGGLLADDMGLGKTLIVLSFLRWTNARTDQDRRPHLVVAPVSLLENWRREYEKFFEDGSPVVEELYGRLSKDWYSRTSENRLYLTTYETVRNHQLTFGRVDWGVVVLDEAQRIKTPGTLVTNAAKALKATFKIAMTGTPVENTLVDLWCIVDFLVPGHLGSAREFSREFERPRGGADTDIKQLGEKLRTRLGSLLKRRLKKDVLSELPTKTEHTREREMPSGQRSSYMSILRHVQQLRETGASTPGAILSALTKLRLISDHPFLVGRQTQQLTTEELLSKSAKLQELVEVLETVRELEEKAIIFADLKESQRMIAKILSERFGLSPRIVNGDTPSRPGAAKLSRQQAIDEFEASSGFNTIVMSPIAAGVGLNVTAANHVIHFSRHWNPAKEQQATDRAYRIGQDKNVHVYYLMATLPDITSFDISLDKLLRQKKSLAEATLFPTERVEVRQSEILDEIIQEASGLKETATITWSEIEMYSPSLFESFVGCSFQNQGYSVEMLGVENNYGAAFTARNQIEFLVVAIGVGERDQAMKDVQVAQAHFSGQHGGTAIPVLISEEELDGHEESVRVISIAELREHLETTPIFFSEVLAMETSRVEAEVIAE